MIAPWEEKMATATPVPTFDHIVVVMEESYSFNQIVGDTTDAPYINNTLIGGVPY